MGVQTATMARIFKGQKKRKTGEEETLIWETFPHTGLSKVFVNHKNSNGYSSFFILIHRPTMLTNKLLIALSSF